MSQQLYRQNSYRNTATHQAGRVPTATMPDLNFSQPAKAAQQMVEHADGMTNALVDEMEYSASLVEENRIFNIVQNASSEFLRRSNIADGLEGSWYDEQGVFREKDFKEWENEQYNLLSQTSTAAFIRPESKMKVRQNAMDTRQKLNKQFTAALAADVPRRAQARFEKSLKQHMDAGDYDGSRDLVAGNPNLNKEDAKALNYEIDQEEARSKIDRAQNNLDELEGLYKNKAFKDSLNDDNFTRLENLYRSKKRTSVSAKKKAQKEMDAEKSRVAKMAEEGATKAQKNKAELDKAEAEALAPDASPYYIKEHAKKYNGKFKNNLSAQREGVNLLKRYARDFIDQPGDAADLNELKALADYMQLEDESVAKKCYDEVCNEITGAGALPVDKIIDSIPDATWLQSSYDGYGKEANEIKSIDNKIKTLETGMKSLSSRGEKDAVQKQITAMRKQQNALRTKHSKMAEDARGRAKSRFDEWMRQGGSNLTPNEQAAQLSGYFIEETYVQKVKTSPLVKQAVLDAERRRHVALGEATERNRKFNEEQAKYNAKEAEERKKEDAADSISESILFHHDLSDEPNNKLPESATKNRLYVPKGSQIPNGTFIKYRTADSVVNVEILHYDGEGVRVSSKLSDIIQKAEGNAPQSVYVADGFLIPNRERIYKEQTEEENHIDEEGAEEAMQVSDWGSDGLFASSKSENKDSWNPPSGDLPLP